MTDIRQWQKDRPRPEPGASSTKEIRVRVCSGCGYMIDDAGGCDYECEFDTEIRNASNVFVAVYERTDKFLRDEHGVAK